MFEFSVASKYLIPRRRQLSVSIISLISVLVIALVVWLIVVFFSVTDGLEKNWIQKLTALTAPVRITPTDAYYQSYYYQIDSISESSNYSLKTIREKKDSLLSDPYNPEFDQEPPPFWPQPDLNADGQLKDLTQLAFASLDEVRGIEGLKAQDFELTASHIQIGLQREMTYLQPSNFFGGNAQSTISYPAFLGNFDSDNPQIEQTLLPVTNADINNFISLIATVQENNQEDLNQDRKLAQPKVVRQRMIKFFKTIQVTKLKPKTYGWTIPPSFFPSEGFWECCAIFREQSLTRIIVALNRNEIPLLQKTFVDQGLKSEQGQIRFSDGKVFWNANGDSNVLDINVPVTLISTQGFQASLIMESIEKAARPEDLLFEIAITIQGNTLKDTVPYRGLEIDSYQIINEQESPWIHSRDHQFILPADSDYGEGILLPKSFKEAGVLIGDRGSLSYVAPTVSILQEQFIPIYVAGFYDPGIIPIGQKFILTNPQVTTLIRSSHQQDDKTAITNGINVRFNRNDQADQVKSQLLSSFNQHGIGRYWKIETFREFEFTKEIMRELQSQKNLFMLIAVVIILVACSNIISMLIILVNDKKTEIGILRSMGASSKSIALIFGMAGAAIGILGSVIGIALAIFTLHHLDLLIGFLSQMQGHEMFSSHFYGRIMPNQLSYEALLFVIVATIVISLLAGIVPAIKACLVRPSTTLRSSGG